MQRTRTVAKQQANQVWRNGSVACKLLWYVTYVLPLNTRSTVTLRDLRVAFGIKF